MLDADQNHRFQQYVSSLLHPSGPQRQYPGLPSRPWHDPAQFSVVEHLEAVHADVAAEVAALDPSAYQGESEAIPREGDWDVVFFQELGLRRERECAACPTIARTIDNFPVVTTQNGLVYVSRLRAGSRVLPHRGPTNVRVRCHLGLDVPEGDCAIRVGDEVRHWETGRCLVFDDSYEHEVWNNTDQDRTVLILDLWNPALSPAEVDELKALSAYVMRNARSLLSYWLGNSTSADREH